MAHLVITIGCEYGAKGNQIGRKVADDLGIRFYDREMVDEIIREVGIPKEIMEKVEEIDTLINEHTTGWKTTRMNKVDLTILRLAVYEIKWDEDVPTGVAINEAVNLAKKYSSEGGASFVNGVLAKLAD